MKRKFFLILFFFVAVALSCTYTPEGSYISPIKLTVPSATISLNNFDNKDTIRIYQATSFSFSVTAQNVTISGVNVILDRATLGMYTTTSGSFSVDGANLTTGTFLLKILFTSNSGSGSLADKSGVETISEWKSWVLVIDVDPPAKPVLTKTIQNGFLKISWTPFTKNTFTSYVLQKFNYYENRFITITDPKKTSFVDSSYVGDNGSATNYYLTVNTKTGNATSDPKIVDDAQSLAVVYNVADSTAHLTWRSSKYTSAFKDVEIFENGSSRTLVVSPTDTTLALRLNSVLLGQPSTVGIVVHAKYPPKIEYQPFTKDFTIDNPTGALVLPTYQTFMYNKALDQIISLDFANGRVNFFDQSLQVVNYMSQSIGSFSLPYPGNYLYTNQGGVNQINLVSKSSATVITKGRWGGTYSPVLVSGSDNQLISYGVLDNSSFPDNEYTTTVTNMSQSKVYDYTDGWEHYVPNYQFNNTIPILADDGRYAIKGSGVYQVTADTLSQLGYLPSGSIKFRPDNTDEMIQGGVPTNILKTTDQSVLRTLTLPVGGYTQKSYDVATKQILYEAPYANTVYLVNIDTKQVKAIPAYSIGWVFVNGWLINQGSGYAKKIQ